MKGARAAVRYAKALMQMAQEQKILDAICADMKLIQTAIEENKKLALMLQSPLIKGKKKEAVLTTLFSNKVNEVTERLIRQIIAQGRESILELICADFIKQYNAVKNIAKVSVTTSKQLTENLKTQLIEKITKEYQLSKVELEEIVDGNIIGGLILRIEDKQLDASVKRQLKDIKKELIQA